MGRRISAAEIIATHIGWDLADMAGHRYQPSRFKYAIYTCPEDYYQCPPAGCKPVGDYVWEPVVDEYIAKRFPNRTIYISKMKGNQQ